MTERIASLPMYDADRSAVEALWRSIADALREKSVVDVPRSLVWPADLNLHWRDPRLLLGQTCGFPLMTGLSPHVQVVGAFRYSAPGCAGIDYRSELVARADAGSFDDGGTIDDFRGRIAAINSVDSHSGCNALRGLVDPLADNGRFFGRWIVSGSHRQSLALVRAGTADIAAIDCITLAGLRRHRPELLDGLRVVGSTPRAPGLPLVTAASTSASDLASLRHALNSVCIDPDSSALRQALFIDGFEVVPASTWRVIDDLRIKARDLAWN